MFLSLVASTLLGQFVGGDVPPGYEHLAARSRAQANAAPPAPSRPARPETAEAKKARLKAEARSNAARESARRKQAARTKNARQRAYIATHPSPAADYMRMAGQAQADVDRADRAAALAAQDAADAGGGVPGFAPVPRALSRPMTGSEFYRGR